MSVYFIRCAATDLIKIGHTNDVWRRLTMLQTGSAGELVVMAVVDGDEQTEARFHGRFNGQRVRGEWFENKCGLKAFLYEQAKPKRPRKNTGLCTRLHTKCGLGKGYASEVARGRKDPGLHLACKIYRTIGFKVARIADATDDEIAVLEKFSRPHGNWQDAA